MAYLKALRLDCQYPGCVKPARQELFDRENASCGIFCAPHGQRRLAMLERSETAECKPSSPSGSAHRD